MILVRTVSVLLALALSTPAVRAGTFFVDAALGSGANDGSSWADAFQGPHGLQTAFAASSAGDQVFAAQGTYLPSSSGSRTASFILKTGVEVYGGFLGGESSPAERPPLGTAPTILSGDLAGNDGGGTLTENSFHVVRGGGANATAVLDGFTVSGGNANTTGSNNDRGGGILCVGAQSPTIRGCRFVANRCIFGGGAGYINLANAAPTFTDCSFEDNHGGSFGGAFDIAQAGTVRFERCVFRGNSASRAGALEIFATNGVVVSQSLFHDNTATGVNGSGALWMGSGGTTQVEGCTIVANTATNQAVGGLRNQGATVVVANCILWDNAGSGGAQAAANQIAGASPTYSIVEGGLAGVGNLALDPQFADAGAGDFSLGATSPAIDAGDNAAVLAGVTLDLAGAPRFVDDPSVADTGSGTPPLVDIGAHEHAPAGASSFCDASDGSLAACPCANPGAPDSGCDLPQATGGVALAVLSQSTSPNGVTMQGTGFPSASSPAAIVIRSNALDPSAPVVFGDGVRCIATVPLVRLAATSAVGGTSTHLLGHSAGAGPGTFHYQLWFRSTPSTFCDPLAAFNLSNGRTLSW